MNLERIGYPLVIVSALAGLFVWLRKPGTINTVVGGNGFDPGRWSGQAAGFEPRDYIMDLRGGPLDPAYLAAATKNLFSSDPESNPLSAPAVPDYLTENVIGYGQSITPSYMMESHGGCGCGGSCGGSGGCGSGSGGCNGCKSKCASECNTGVRFQDGRGGCMSPETKIPDYLPIGAWMGNLNQIGFQPNQSA